MRAHASSARIYVSTFVRKLVNDLLNEIEVKLDADARTQVEGATLHSLARSLLERSGGTSDLSLGPYVIHEGAGRCQGCGHGPRLV
jgi:hypothetical protein